jgi:hypothetical protein
MLIAIFSFVPYMLTIEIMSLFVIMAVVCLYWASACLSRLPALIAATLVDATLNC